MSLLLAVSTLAACAVQSLRWLRVAQREHYLPSVGVFAVRWWRSSPLDLALAMLAVAAGISAVAFPLAVLLVVAVVIMAPAGLPLTGRTSGLAWTMRMRATAVVAAVMTTVLVMVGLVAGFPLVYAVVLIGFPWLVDLALV